MLDPDQTFSFNILRYEQCLACRASQSTAKPPISAHPRDQKKWLLKRGVRLWEVKYVVFVAKDMAKCCDTCHLITGVSEQE